MNYTAAIFLINKQVRGVTVTYDPADKTGQGFTFKTLDPAIIVDDLVIIPTGTRHGFTVAKVNAIDVDVDLDSAIEYKWLAGKFSSKSYEEILEQEKLAIAKIKSAEIRKKRDDMREALFKDQEETLKALPMYTNEEEIPTA